MLDSFTASRLFPIMCPTSFFFSCMERPHTAYRTAMRHLLVCDFVGFDLFALIQWNKFKSVSCSCCEKEPRDVIAMLRSLVVLWPNHTCSAHNISIHTYTRAISWMIMLIDSYFPSSTRYVSPGNVMWHATPRKRKKSFTCRDSKRQGNSTRVLYFDCHLRTEGLRVWKVPCNFESIIIDDDWWCLVSCWLSLSLSISALISLSCYFRIVALIKLSSFPLPFFFVFRIQQRARNISDIWSKREASQCNVLHSSKQLNIPGVIWIIQRFYPSSNLD